MSAHGSSRYGWLAWPLPGPTANSPVISLAEFQGDIVLDIISKIIIPITAFYIAATCGNPLSYGGHDHPHRCPRSAEIIIIVMIGHYIWLTVLYLLAGAYSGKEPLGSAHHYGPI